MGGSNPAERGRERLGGEESLEGRSEGMGEKLKCGLGNAKKPLLYPQHLLCRKCPFLEGTSALTVER